MYSARENSQFNFELINFISNNLFNQAGITYINKPFLLLIYTPRSIEYLFTEHIGGSFRFYFFKVFNDV